MDITRKLLTVRRIADINLIENADSIVCATVDGWNVVVQKDQFSVGEIILYFEIDSWVPHSLAPFLSKGKEPRTYFDIHGERLKTIRLRGCLSQGLILPLSILPEDTSVHEGDDLTELFGILKYEKSLSANLQGIARGNFPSFLVKTDQERVQNCKKFITENVNELFEVTEKLDGSSMTVYWNKDIDTFGVCSRNLDLLEDDTNTFWSVAKQLDLKNKLMSLDKSYALQGELIGPGIQGNKYTLYDLDYYIFDVYDIDAKKYLNPNERLALLSLLELKSVPIIDIVTLKPLKQYDNLMSSILAYAEGVSMLNKLTIREGVVFKMLSSPKYNQMTSFKAISNTWLVKNE